MSLPHSEPIVAPLVSLIIPTCNLAGLLEETLESLLAQKYEPIELIVVDDGSTDETPEVLDRVSARSGGRLRTVRHENMGQARSINRAFDMVSGKYVGVISSGDPQPPDLIGPLVHVLESEPEILLVYPHRIRIDDQGGHVDRVHTLEYSYVDLVRWVERIPGSGALFRRELIQQVGGYDPNFRFCPDYDWLLRAGLMGPFKPVPQVLSEWRHHTGSLTAGSRGEAVARDLVHVIEKFYERDDLPAEVQAVRPEALRNAYIMAGLSVSDAAGGSRARFEITDRIGVLHIDPDMRREPALLNPDATIQWLQQEVAARDKIIGWWHAEGAERDKTATWLHAEVAERDSTIAWLHGELSARDRDATIQWLHQEVAARDKAIGWLHAEVAERDKLATWLHAEVAERDKIATWLHAEVAERDKTATWLHAEVAERDRTIARLRAELSERDRILAEAAARNST